MKKKRKNAARSWRAHRKKIIVAIVFCCLLVLCYQKMTWLLIPKETVQEGEWGHTTSLRHFYEMEENSIDVLFLGSSIGLTDFCPQEIYDYSGVRSYSLCSASQGMISSYYWLKEALQYQKPKVVVVDLHFLFDVVPKSPFNVQEPFIRAAMDPMKLSPVKREAIDVICSEDATQSKIDYYVPIHRYHDRWSKLAESDFEPIETPGQELKGYSALFERAKETFEPYVRDESTVYQVDTNASGRKYLEEIGRLCRENDIQPVFVSLPFYHSMDDGIHNTCAQVAKECGADYIDFAEKSVYESLNIKEPEENVVGHGNVGGAIKMAHFFGDLFRKKYGVKCVTDAQWEETKPYFERIKQNYALANEENVYKYLNALTDESYSILMIAGVPPEDGGESMMTKKMQKSLEKLGFAGAGKIEKGESRFFIRTPEDGVREAARTDGPVTGNLRNYRKLFEMESVYFGTQGDRDMLSVIKVDSLNMAAGVPQEDGYNKTPIGISMVVYDNSIKKFAGNACFFMWDDKMVHRFYGEE